MTHCPDCGTELKEGYKFCISCGATVEHVEETEAKKRFCPKCGAELAKGMEFCSSCGARTREPSMEKAGAGTRFVSYARKYKILAMGLVLLVIFVVFAFASMEDESYNSGGMHTIELIELTPCTMVVPNIVVTNYVPTGTDWGRLTYTASFELNNPNQVPVYLSYIEYRIYMQDVIVSEGTYSEQVSIPARGGQTIEKQGEIVVQFGGHDMNILYDAAVNGKINVRMEGTVYYANMEGYKPLPPVPFSRELANIPIR